MDTIVETNQKKPTFVIGLVAALFLISSAIHIHKLFDTAWYWEIFSYMPSSAILIRYCVSWGQRFVGIVCAFGILSLNEFFRKLILVIEVFTILTVWLKHPYQGFYVHALKLDEQFAEMLQVFEVPFLFSDYTLLAVILACFLDVVFAAAVIYYFTRPSVKKLYASQKKMVTSGR